MMLVSRTEALHQREILCASWVVQIACIICGEWLMHGIEFFFHISYSNIMHELITADSAYVLQRMWCTKIFFCTN